MLACSMFISGADKCRYGGLKTELINDHAKGMENWPTNVDEAIQLLHTYQAKKQPRSNYMGQMEMAFAQSGDCVNVLRIVEIIEEKHQP